MKTTNRVFETTTNRKAPKITTCIEKTRCCVEKPGPIGMSIYIYIYIIYIYIYVHIYI